MALQNIKKLGSFEDEELPPVGGASAPAMKQQPASAPVAAPVAPVAPAAPKPAADPVTPAPTIQPVPPPVPVPAPVNPSFVDEELPPPTQHTSAPPMLPPVDDSPTPLHPAGGPRLPAPMPMSDGPMPLHPEGTPSLPAPQPMDDGVRRADPMLSNAAAQPGAAAGWGEMTYYDQQKGDWVTGAASAPPAGQSQVAGRDILTQMGIPASYTLSGLATGSEGERLNIGPNHWGAQAEWRNGAWRPVLNGQVRTDMVLSDEGRTNGDGNKGGSITLPDGTVVVNEEGGPIDPRTGLPSGGGEFKPGSGGFGDEEIPPPGQAPAPGNGGGGGPFETPTPENPGTFTPGSPIHTPGDPPAPTPQPMDDRPAWDDFYDRGEQLLRQRLGTFRDDQMRQSGEIMASRGVLGGSPELWDENMGVSAINSRVMQQYNEGIHGLDANARAEGLQRDQMSQQDRQFQAQLNEQRMSRLGSQSLQERALDLQKEGMSQDEAFRRAALLEDTRFREMAQQLQREGMTFEQSMRTAEFMWQQSMGNQSMENQREGMENQRRGMDNQTLMNLWAIMQYLPEDQRAAFMDKFGGM